MWRWLKRFFKPLDDEIRLCSACHERPALANSEQCKECRERQAFQL